MKKGAIIALSIAGALVVTGIIVGVIGVNAFHGNFTSLDRHEYLESPFSFNETVTKIDIDENIADIEFKYSEDAEITVICEELKNAPHTVTVVDGTLSIKSTYQYIGWWDWFKNGPILDNTSITISLPNVSYSEISISNNTGDIVFTNGFTISNVDIVTNTGDILLQDFVSDDVKIMSDTGNIVIKNGSGNPMEIDSETGNVNLEEVTCSSMKVHTSTGSVTLKSVVCSGDMDLDTSTGDVKFEASDAINIDVNSSTGNITGTLLAAKTFHCSSSTGSVHVPSGTGVGVFNAHTSTGNISITIL